MIIKILIAIAVVLLALLVIFRKKIREIRINKPLFIIGLSLALVGAGVMFHGSILGENNSGIATIIGIVGISLIAASNFRLLK
ncbi:hypothetical protein ACFLZC_02020 [Patescibacteria group bacterium]